jgi:hypothetical protein
MMNHGVNGNQPATSVAAGGGGSNGRGYGY